MDVFTTIIAEEVLKQVVTKREERAALSQEKVHVRTRIKSPRKNMLRTAALLATLPSGQVTRLKFAAPAKAARAMVVTASLKTMMILGLET